ncbi:MAG: hypothetical protein ABH818_00510 [Patescibacteria group bacterium]|nr:hypothetical protein [Patescibacteria group bacterium]MBU1870575.1 hypothetical protein [Patescibacteria group bacterium]
MSENKGLEKLSDLFNLKSKKPPTYQWQDLALQIIRELSIPNNKRNSVFKICKENSRVVVMTCFNDTKELCQTGQQWRYFFKLINRPNYNLKLIVK